MTLTENPTGIAAVMAAANRIILGKDRQIRLALACLLARGHLLIEDLPGVGKTTLAHTLAKLLGLQFSRIQFTSDMLPADIIGLSIYDRERNDFRFLPGTLFSHVLLADEINRATPKTQSALLEAMEERQVTIEGETRPLPEPFFVIATQNPSTQIGTFPLPESQLDRFLMRIELGYPDRHAERVLLESGGRRDRLTELTPSLPPDLLATLQNGSDPLDYKGSYAGAMGIPQFMPSSQRNYAVDFDGDERIDLRQSPADAIGSVARFLNLHGWRQEEPIAAPATVDGDPVALIAAGIKPAQPLRALIDQGASLAPPLLGCLTSPPR